MESHMYENLRKLINVVDELRDVGLQQFINLPRICVCGTQSSGKSSVLESIVGLDFLPRGEGVVTRRPLEMRLVHLSETSHKAEEAWAVFEGDREKKKFTDFEQVRKEIDRLTDQVAGQNKGIVDDPIVLTIYATQCPDLTLIDLPGITRVPLKGSEQNDDIERVTRDMSMRYVNDPRTIVLAVISANTDISTSDALQLARRADPKGVRTIGVITKIDLMDRGTDAVRMLQGEDIPLRLGYVGVRNRSQQDIRSGKKIKDALEDEKMFFANHPTYRALPPTLLGSRSLTDKLTKVLFRHIRHFLPEIKREINVRVRTLQGRLDELGLGVPVDVAERVQLIWTMITDYCEIYKSTIRGKYDRKLQHYFENELPGGAHIRALFNELLEEFVDISVTKEMSDVDIDTAIRMHEGDSLPGFPSPDTFEYLILPHLKKIQTPVVECLDRVAQAMEALSQKIANRVFGRFPKLADRVLEMATAIMSREKEGTKKIIDELVAAETGYLFTNDSDYLLQHGAMIPMQQQQQQLMQTQQMQQMRAVGNGPVSHPPGSSPSVDGNPPQQSAADLFANSAAQAATGAVVSQAQSAFASGVQASGAWGAPGGRKKTRYSAAFLQEIRRRLDAYFNIVLRNVRDTVPKVIGYFLVRSIQEKLQFELYNELNKADLISELLGEPPHIVEERKAIQGQLGVFKKAATVLQRDPHIASLNLDMLDENFEADLAEHVMGRDRPQQPAATPAPTANGPSSVAVPAPAPPPPHAQLRGQPSAPGAPTRPASSPMPPQQQPPQAGGGGGLPRAGSGGHMAGGAEAGQVPSGQPPSQARQGLFNAQASPQTGSGGGQTVGGGTSGGGAGKPSLFGSGEGQQGGQTHKKAPSNPLGGLFN
uniref:Dynamin-type G domain-containing protein n=1 Tax=Chromera velia CCMP2878 TaxID=1169474 RepID=A0A0G4FVQ9_9ALVE|eukprot:Cvel_18924.t1-p1 / transcript=Cvel_18924.t1 / gene=Cvel_18924 / organism=Chromera_velia_CCMP2878 / gene_product=Vacuolar protein sorting-associated protein 1, putative / transcript_product=Vacuolar protein sorting-associated protein 1, putative / location=Cvel_scaffold1596:13390-26263(+) / protein_length=877 / sequence_SO=supercontig / SO=protein_coding / is_pseudo=false